MEGSFNSEHKLFIRENWNKPLLKFLAKKVEDKLIYLGLTSPNAEDVKEWIEYIKIVFAFQCRTYGEASNENQNRNTIEKLNSFLNKLEREGKIDNYFIFDGYLEEVVLRGYDNSPKRIDFDLNNFVTLYNLDFCNKITSPISFVNKNGEQEKAYKFDAIKKLLQIQKSLSSVSNKFIFFLTVHCSYDEEEIRNFINKPPSQEIIDYIDRCNSLTGHEKNSRIVRLFFAYYIKQQFEAFGFTPKVLPSLFYQGLNKTNLLHFSVFGINPANKLAGVVPTYQNLTDIINQKFISIDDSKFINKTDKFEGEVDVGLDPVKYFSDSETFSKIWI